MGDIAVVGLDCRFPQAPTPAAFWDLLTRGAHIHGPAPSDSLPPRAAGAGRGTTAPGGHLADAEAFDNDFFGITRKDAAAMDPHHRLLLQCAWRALEDTGRSPADYAGTGTGVFLGVMAGEWARLRSADAADPARLAAAASGGMAANQISYRLDLRGPSTAVDSACSSALLAVHTACASLQQGDCDLALAGGANLVLSPDLGAVYARMGIAAPDGRCKPFSADADGIGRSDGVGLVVLRPLADALADGQRVYAVIRASAVTQDGRSNGLTAPSRWSQARAVRSAYERAGVTPDQVRFVEAHGTGTALGDTIECAALGDVHGVARDRPCAIGSVKGNIGHTEAAAGIAGLLKTVLALHHRLVPASPFSSDENPRLRLAERGLSLLRAPLRLDSGETVAAVSSFGMGGTNVHAVLSSAPPKPYYAGAPTGSRTGVFVLTADSPAALRRNLTAQAKALAGRGRTDATALCWTSSRVKTGLAHRFATTAEDTAGLLQALAAAADEVPDTGTQPPGPPRAALLFSGQSAGFPGMGAGLYRRNAVFAGLLDRADAALRPHTGRSVTETVLAGARGPGGPGRPDIDQPAVFALQYALAATLAEAGVEPVAVVGHSLGEYAAAVIAGVLELDDAAAVVAARGAALNRLPAGGGMLAVAAAPDDVTGLLAADGALSLAAVNGPRDVVVSGPRDRLEALARELARAGTVHRLLPVGQAFHSALVEPALAQIEAAGARLRPGPARTPLYSTLTGGRLDTPAMDGSYWREQARRPVRFDAALAALDRDLAPTHLIEIGPAHQLLPVAARAGLRGDPVLLHPCPGAGATDRDLAETVAALYRHGLDPQWAVLCPAQHRVTVPLPGYVFSPDGRYPTRSAGPDPAAAAVRARAGEDGAARTDGGAGRQDAAPDPDRDALRRTAGDGQGAPDASRVLRAVIEAVTEIGDYEPSRVVRSARFYEDLGFDSVMVMQLKDHIDTRLPRLRDVTVQQLLPALTSVDSLARFLSGPAAGTN